MKHSSRWIIAVSATLLTMACQKAATSSSVGALSPGAAKLSAGANVIRVGEYGSLTGSEATFGQSVHHGVMLATNEQNALGGVKGKKIEIISYDDQGKSQEAGTAATRLITDDKVVALLGEFASSLSIAGGRVAQQYQVPMISPGSTNPQVTEIGDMISRVCFIDPFQGFVMAKFARVDLKADRVALLFDQAQAYSKGLKDNFKESFVKMGGTITSEQAYTGGDQDYSAQLTTIRETHPQAIFIPGYYTDVGNLALQARKLGITVPLLGGDGWDSAKLAEIGGDAIEGGYFSNHYSVGDTSPAVQDFVRRYQASFHALPDSQAALGYDAAKLLFDAIGRAASLSGKDLAAAIAQTKDLHGVTGNITLDDHRNARKPAVVLQMKQGKPTFVTSIAPE